MSSTETIVTAGKPGINVTALIGAVAAQGNDYTDARNALIAHALATGVKQSVVATESKVDKGDVNRINAQVFGSKSVTKLSAVNLKALKALVLSDMVATDPATLGIAINLGAKSFRRGMGAIIPVKADTDTADTADTETPRTAKVQTADENSDPLAGLYAWLLASTSTQFDARVNLIMETLARVETDREALAAA